MHFDPLKVGCICNRLIICICLKWVECGVALSVHQALSFFIYGFFFYPFSSHMDCSSTCVFILMAQSKVELLHLPEPALSFIFSYWKVFTYNRNTYTTDARENICSFDQRKWIEEHLFVFLWDVYVLSKSLWSLFHGQKP